jgi:hypothetical protein
MNQSALIAEQIFALARTKKLGATTLGATKLGATKLGATKFGSDDVGSDEVTLTSTVSSIASEGFAI